MHWAICPLNQNLAKLLFRILTIERVCHSEGYYSVKGRPFAALAFRTGGSGDFEINGEHFVSGDGDILFLPQNLSYKVQYSKCEIIVVHFTKCNYKKLENIKAENTKYIKGEFEKMLKNWQLGHSVNGAKASVYKILQYIADEKTPSVTDSVFKKCIEFIDENYSSPELGIPDICHAAGISESGLLRKFHGYYNTSPKKYITDKRIAKAVDLLASGELSVKSVAQMCGFNDEKYFSRIIKAKYNQTPSSFVKRTLI